MDGEKLICGAKWLAERLAAICRDTNLLALSPNYARRVRRIHATAQARLHRRLRKFFVPVAR